MTVQQIYKIVNNVASQMYGETSPQITNMTGIVSLGNDVMSSESTKDTFLNTLVDKIGKTIISQRAYSANVSSLINDAFTFGAILQKIYVAPLKSQESQHWNLTQGTSIDQYVINKPSVKQKLFNKRTTWDITITIPDFQLKSAFTSETEMATFIDAIYLAIRNSQEVYLAGMAEMCYANMIGERVVHTMINGGHTVVNLLLSYNNLMGTNLTTAQAMASTEFLKFASMTINLYVKRMGIMSVIYNAEGYARFTPKDRMRVIMLADFTSAVTSYLQSNTYHDELVALPEYTEIPYWQGIGAGSSNFDNTGTVAVTTASGYTLKQEHVVCMLCDEEAIGLTYDNRRSKSAYNANGEYTNMFEKADMGYFNDLSENAVIFTVGAIATPTLSYFTPVNGEFSISAPTNLSTTATLNGTTTVSAVNYNGAVLSADNYTANNNVYTFKSAWLATLSKGSYEVDIELSTNAILPFIFNVVD